MNAFLSLTMAALLSLTLASPAQSEAMVMTPGGLRPNSNALQIPEGGSIKLTANEIQLLDASNKTIHVALRSDAKIAPSAATSASSSLQTGWISYAQWHRTDSPIQNFLTTWTVPPNPPADDGQLVYLFNALVPDSGTAILQPVLQWGVSPAGGGPYWAVANWYVSDSTAYWSTLQNVTVGQSLQGVLQRTAQNADGTVNYVSQFANIPGVTVLNNSPELTRAYETLEAYRVTARSDYPNGCTVFSGIDITTSSGSAVPSWQTADDNADGIHTKVGSNGDISICYPSSG
ncbi:hypothetical protein L218DRAFT_72614 [Marasmius fiardii PR-910]|nr:hypothetical protein L218DRAFT_72614 [Marasmius fiardii PR-910]